jgi:hypothetical protein
MRARIVPSPLGVLVALAVAGGCGGNSGIIPFQQIGVVVFGVGTGGGRLLSTEPAIHIDCLVQSGLGGGSCTDTIMDAGAGGVFDVVATPDPGSVFAGWRSSPGKTGCTVVSGPICTLTFQVSDGTVDFTVGARFDLVTITGVNLLQDPGFEGTVAVGGLPTVTGQWRGDSVYTVGQNQGITPHASSNMLRFVYGGPSPSALISSQVWQLVDVSALTTEIDAGKIQMDASAWFNRVTGDVNTDTRFDLRVHPFTGSPASFPTDYPSPTVKGDSVFTTGDLWQQVSVIDTLPVGTRYLAVEIYAYENIQNDLTDPEFDGHYADDLSLVLTLLP